MDMEAIVGKLENHGARLRSLEEYQDKQNGHIKDIRDELHGLKMWLMGGMLTIILMLVGLIVKG